MYPSARELNTSKEVIDYVQKCLSELGGEPGSSITFGHKDYTWTLPELDKFRERVVELANGGTDILVDPWPGPDKEWPDGKTTVMWEELYTEERLLQRTTAIYNAALRIYNEIIDQWLPTFNRRNQMSYALPFRLVGQLRNLPTQGKLEANDRFLVYWQDWANSISDSGIFFELEPKESATGDDTQARILATQEKFLAQGKPYFSGQSVLHGHEPRPASTLARDWLTSDLTSLNWASL